MTNNPESGLFDFATSNRTPETEDEKMVTELHAALGIDNVPLRLRRPPVAKASRSWRHYFPLAAAIVMVLALLGASFSALVPDDHGDDQFASVPPVVLGVQSPVAGACDLSGDVPLFSGTNESPIAHASVILTLDRKLKMVCGGDETILAEGIMLASPTRTPHVLLALTDTNETLILNIYTGGELAIPQPQAAPQQGISATNFGSWHLDRSTDDDSKASIYNLESLTETHVTSGDERVALETITSTMFSANGDTILLAVEDGFFIAHAQEAPHFVPATLEDDPRQIAISPIGNRFAVSSYSYREGPNYHQTTISMYDAATGEMIQEWSLDTGDRFIDLAWTNDGDGLLFTDHNALYMATADGPQTEPKVVLESEGVSGLVLTRDPEVVAISLFSDEKNRMPTSVTSLVNLETGDITMLQGRDSWAGSTLSAERSTLVLSNPLIAGPGESQSLQVVNAVTGELVGEIRYTNANRSGFSSSTWGVGSDITLVAFGTDSIWRLVDDEGNPKVIAVPAIPVEAEALSVSISPDGYLAALTYGPPTAWLMSPGSDEWMEINLATPEESEGVLPSVSFILGEE